MKKFAGVFLVFSFFAYMFCYIILSSFPVSTDMPASGRFEGKDLKYPNYRQRQEELLDFFKEHFLGKNGKIATNLKNIDSGQETLSESVGLLMNYCILADNRELFDKEVMFLKDSLLVEGKHVKWKTGKDIHCNAAIDDLRIVRALLDAYDKWGEKEYLDTAGFIQGAVYESQVSDKHLREFYNWKYKSIRNSIPLCYLDLYTMDKLGYFNDGWPKTAERGLAVLKGGRLEDSSPFYYKYYSYETEKYLQDEEAARNKGICLTYTLYVVLHLVEMNENTDFFTEWLKKEMDEGKLYAWYDPDKAKPAREIESTAVYALAAVYAHKAGEKELYCKLLDRMLMFRVTDERSLYFGGFGNAETGDFYSFDNLTALWALSLED